jgi:hypothetical protein
MRPIPYLGVGREVRLHLERVVDVRVASDQELLLPRLRTGAHEPHIKETFPEGSVPSVWAVENLYNQDVIDYVIDDTS